jgi:hypothetical protein
VPRFSAEDIARKQVKRTSAAGPAYEAGINAVRGNPAAAAAASADLMFARLSEPRTKEKYRESLARVTEQSWKEAAITKGSARLTSGIQAAEPKIAAFHREVGPHIDAGLAKIKAMPKQTLEQRIQRSVAMQQHMATFRRRGR